MFGRAETRRTIDVEANLLTERLSEHSRLVRVAHRKLLVIGLSMFVAGALLPSIYGLRAACAKAVAIHEAKAGNLAKTLSTLQADHAMSVPRIDEHELSRTMRLQATRLLGQLSLVLNSVPKNAACSSVKADVMAGEMTLVISADANGFEAMREFVLKASEGPNTTSAILVSTKRSEALGTGSVSFDFVKKARVGN